MNPDDARLDLIRRAIDGTATADDLRALQDDLRADAAFRRLFARYASIDAALGSGRLAVAPVSRVEPLEPRVHRPAWSHLRSWLPLAAAALVLLGFAGWWMTRPSKILEVVNVSGQVRWTPRHGRALELKGGEALPSGRFETVDEDALLRLRFEDGSLVEFNGPMRARINEKAGKRIFVEKGVITASVKPQRPGQPMRLQTPTAELEVLGTVFTLDAVEDDARLSVTEGKVRLRRVADGGVAEVAARQSVVASRNAQESLEPVVAPPPPSEWSATFDPVQESILSGRVLAADAREPRRVRAVGRLLAQALPGEQVIFPRVILAPARTAGAAFVTMTEESEIELRWRTGTSGPVEWILWTRLPTGRFAGLFYLRLPARAATDAEGWQVVRAPMSSFTPGKSQEAQTMAGLEITRFVMSTMNRESDVGLEIAALRVTRRPAP
jgi:ferric-dicitrate binding protein FerR (iron transport regulator)